jgi:hypothetical protein
MDLFVSVSVASVVRANRLQTFQLRLQLRRVIAWRYIPSGESAVSNKGVPAGTASDTVDVQHVIDAYHEAVLTHDGSRLARLFIPQGSMWLNVFSDDAYVRAKAKSPSLADVRRRSWEAR